MSILAGIGDLIDHWLGIEPIGKSPHYRHKSAAFSLKNFSPDTEETCSFFLGVLTQIQNNWLRAKTAGLSNPSRQNWRWKRHPSLSPRNTSPEIMLERRIVSLCGDSWSNQMPTASGLAGPAADKRAAVDLVKRISSREYEFVELKVASDNPLYAAMEIMLYGLLFVWSRKNMEALGYNPINQPVLEATRINLMVLAPRRFYVPYQLGEFGEGLNECLASCNKEFGLEMGFGFFEFGIEPNIDSGSPSMELSLKSMRPAMSS